MEIPKQTNKENPTENIRSVSERWMDKIFENLSRAEQLERIAKSGYMDIDTFNNSFGMDQRIKDNMISSAKVEALNLMVMEFDTIEISGGDVLFSDTFFKTFRAKMSEIRNLSKDGLYSTDRVRTNNNPNKPLWGNLTTLSPKFYETVNKLCELRKLICSELKDTLFLTKQKNKVEGRL